MAEPGQRRKLEAILSADVVGYSRLMQDDDAATVETLTRYRTIFSDFVSRHEGRIVDSPGDNILAEFDSPVEAELLFGLPSQAVLLKDYSMLIRTGCPSS